jgi:hypothetical protein
MTVTADELTGAAVKLVPGKLFIQGTVEVIVTAGVISEDSTQDMKIYVDYGNGKVEHTIKVTLKADETAPSVSELRNPDGDLIQDGDVVMWNETIEITMSEPVTRSSFDAAVSGGLLKVEWGGNVRDVVFTLSEDGKMITLDLNEQIAAGTMTVTISGLSDEAGNEVQPLTIMLEVNKSSDDDGDNTWVIVVIVLVIIAFLVIVAVLVAVVAAKNREKVSGEGDESEGEEKETELPKEPKLI